MPSPSLFCCKLRADSQYMLMRADADGSLCWWDVDSRPMRTMDEHIPSLEPVGGMSLSRLWEECKPVGLLDHVVRLTAVLHWNKRQKWTRDDDTFILLQQAYRGSASVVTSSLYIEMSARLICGMSNGDIIIVPVLSTIKALLLHHGKEGGLQLSPHVKHSRFSQVFPNVMYFREISIP